MYSPLTRFKSIQLILIQQIHKYLQQLHDMLLNFYRHKSLVINLVKTEYMHMDKNINEEDRAFLKNMKSTLLDNFV